MGPISEVPRPTQEAVVNPTLKAPLWRQAVDRVIEIKDTFSRNFGFLFDARSFTADATDGWTGPSMRRRAVAAGAASLAGAAFLTTALPAGAQEQPAGLPATGTGPGPNPENPASGLSTVEKFPPVLDTLDGKLKIFTPDRKAGFNIGDPVLYTQLFSPLVDKYRPAGVEFFIYNNRWQPNSIDWAGPEEAFKLRQRLQNYEADISYFAGFTNGFLNDTAVVIGQRPEDEVTEIHFGIFPNEGIIPTAEELSENDGMLTETMADFIISGTKYDGANPDTKSVRRTLVQRRLSSDSPVYPLTLVTA